MGFLRPIAWLLSFPSVWRHRTRIQKVNMEGIKPPYLLLCNHNAFYDFMVATVATFPHQAFYVVAVDGFIGREWLMRRIGCIGKQKFTNDIALIRHLKTVVERGKLPPYIPRRVIPFAERTRSCRSLWASLSNVLVCLL